MGTLVLFFDYINKKDPTIKYIKKNYKHKIMKYAIMQVYKDGHLEIKFYFKSRKDHHEYAGILSIYVDGQERVDMWDGKQIILV